MYEEIIYKIKQQGNESSIGLNDEEIDVIIGKIEVI